MKRFALLVVVGLVVGSCGSGAVESVDLQPNAPLEDRAPGTTQPETALPEAPGAAVDVPVTWPLEVDPERLPLECGHVPGTGDLAADILGTLRYAYNAELWNVTLLEDGRVFGIKGSDYGMQPLWFESQWELDGAVLHIGMPGSLRYPDTFEVIGEDEHGWLLKDSSILLRRCGHVDPRFDPDAK